MFVQDIFDARQNIFGGVRYLRVLANEFGGQMETMLAAYNAGPEAVRKYGGQVPPFDETRAYVQKVLDALLPVQAGGGHDLSAGAGLVAVTPAEVSDAVFLQHLYRGGELLQAGQVTRGARAPRARVPDPPRRREGEEPPRAGLLQARGLRARRRGLRGAGEGERERPHAAGQPRAGVPQVQPAHPRRAGVRGRGAASSPGTSRPTTTSGLALAQAGEYGRAREHFVKAGSDAMADKMAKALAAEARPVPVPPKPPEGRMPGLTQELPVVTATPPVPVRRQHLRPRRSPSPRPSPRRRCRCPATFLRFRASGAARRRWRWPPALRRSSCCRLPLGRSGVRAGDPTQHRRPGERRGEAGRAGHGRRTGCRETATGPSP